MKIISNWFKFMFVMVALALGFFFCFNVVSVSADEGVEDTTPTTEETTEAVETENQEQQEDNAVIDLFLNHLKDLKWDEAEAIITWVIAYLAANLLTILGFGITLIYKKVQADKNSKAFQEALARMDVEYQEKLLAQEEKFEKALLETQKQNNANVEYFKNQLVEKQDVNTKEIAKCLKGITADLNTNNE